MEMPKENDWTKDEAVSQRCSICREPLTPFGSRMLEDGILCRNCADRLSEWLSEDELALMKTARVRRHLKYRDNNAVRLVSFSPSVKVDGKYDLYIDKADRRFVLSKRKDFIKDNADAIPLSAIREIRLFELKTHEGEGVDLMMEIILLSRFLRKVRFRVNEFPGMERDSDVYKGAYQTAEEYIEAFLEAGVDERRIKKDGE